MQHIILNNPTEQQVLDAAINYLETLSAPCKQYNSCVYRSTSDEACVVGAFIPDGHPALDSIENIGFLINRYSPSGPTPLPPWMYEHIELLVCLQKVHDLRQKFSFLEDYCKTKGLVCRSPTKGFLAQP